MFIKRIIKKLRNKKLPELNIDEIKKRQNEIDKFSKMVEEKYMEIEQNIKCYKVFKERRNLK